MWTSIHHLMLKNVSGVREFMTCSLTPGCDFRSVNHVILVRDATQAPTQPQTAPEGAEPDAQAPSASQAGSSTTLPAPAPVASDAPVAGSSTAINADVEMADNNAPTAAEQPGRSKVDLTPLSDAVTNGASSSSVFKVDGGPNGGEDTTMEDADTANVDQALAVSVGERSSPPPAAGSSSMVVV